MLRGVKSILDPPVCGAPVRTPQSSHIRGVGDDFGLTRLTSSFGDTLLTFCRFWPASASALAFAGDLSRCRVTPQPLHLCL
jgi:hypothetical protein